MAFQDILPVKLGQAAISAAVSTLYIVPAFTRTFVKDIDIANNNSVATLVTVYLVPSGGAAGTGNVLVPNVSVPGKTIWQWTGSQILNSGDAIQVIASATGVTINVSGGEAV